MANTIRIGVQATGAGKASSEIDNLRDKFEKLQKGGAKGFAIGAGAVAAGAAIAALGMAVNGALGFMSDATDAARDMNETVNKSNVVFGSSAKSVEDWGGATATTLGVSKKAAIDAAAGFGFLFTGLGKTKDEAATMSERLVTMAADMASFNNIDPNEALDKLKSGLSGESEPLRRLGIFLTEGKVKAKGLEMGLADANGALTEGAKVTARYALIMEEAGVQVGDAGRTIGELAGQQRVAAAEMADATAALGEEFMPIESEWVKFQLQFVRGLRNIATGFGDLQHDLEWPLDALTSSTEEHLGKWQDDYVRSVGKIGDATSLYEVHLADAQTVTEQVCLAVGTSAKVMAANVADGGFSASEAFGKFVDSVKGDAADLIDNAFDPLITADKLAATNAEIAAARRVIASRTATKAEKADARVLLHSLGQDQAEYLLALAQTGDINSAAYKNGMKAFNKYVDSQHGKVGAAMRAARDEINRVAWLTTFKQMTIQINGQNVTIKTKALGGPVAKDEPYLVGEQGPEMFVPASNGTIIPHGSGSGTAMGGGSITINFQTMFAPTAAQAQIAARAILPELTREMRRQGVL